MHKLEETFAGARGAKRLALIGYLPALWPSPRGFSELAEAAFDAGMDALEVGFPASDPFLDGEVIRKALAAQSGDGFDALSIPGLTRPLAAKGRTLIAMMYGKAWYELGGSEAPAFLVDAGFAGALVVGTGAEDWESSAAACRGAGIDPVGFAGIGLENGGLTRLGEQARGFIYIPSREGKTGGDGDFGPELRARIARIKAAIPELPVAVGFGVNSPEDIVALRELGADAAIVGTALVEAARDRVGFRCFVAALRAAAEGRKS
ncbi:MAG: tryptophan synthase subunit alpha [Spirochaetota bacterium]